MRSAISLQKHKLPTGKFVPAVFRGTGSANMASVVVGSKVCPSLAQRVSSPVQLGGPRLKVFCISVIPYGPILHRKRNVVSDTRIGSYIQWPTALDLSVEVMIITPLLQTHRQCHHQQRKSKLPNRRRIPNYLFCTKPHNPTRQN